MEEAHMPVDRGAVQRAQTQALLDAFEGLVDTDPPNWNDAPDGEDPPELPRSIFRRGRLLVRDTDADRVTALLARLFTAERTDFPFEQPNLIVGLSQIALPNEVDTLTALRGIDAELGIGVATPDHLISIAPGGRCPATEPQVVSDASRPWPPPRSGGPDGAGVLVGVIDTGLLEQAPSRHPWLAGVTGEFEPETDAAGDIPQYTGHGTFIAGVVRTIAPRSDVHVARTLDRAGGAFETQIALKIVEFLGAGVDVVSLSAGTYSHEDQDLLALRVVIETQLPRSKGVVLVAAAGNDSGRTPFLPAGMTGTVSVGALSARGDDRAWFSNHGGWVDVFAPGEGLVNAYASGRYVYREPPVAGQAEQFRGMARWSGTSFSTPIVAGLIAARMSATGENGVRSAQSLLALGRMQAIPGVGAVLRPDDANYNDHDCRCRS
jgi:subtilisin family serine protease